MFMFVYNSIRVYRFVIIMLNYNTCMCIHRRHACLKFTIIITMLETYKFRSRHNMVGQSFCWSYNYIHALSATDTVGVGS